MAAALVDGDSVPEGSCLLPSQECAAGPQAKPKRGRGRPRKMLAESAHEAQPAPAASIPAKDDSGDGGSLVRAGEALESKTAIVNPNAVSSATPALVDGQSNPPVDSPNRRKKRQEDVDSHRARARASAAKSQARRQREAVANRPSSDRFSFVLRNR